MCRSMVGNAAENLGTSISLIVAADPLNTQDSCGLLKLHCTAWHFTAIKLSLSMQRFCRHTVQKPLDHLLCLLVLQTLLIHFNF